MTVTLDLGSLKLTAELFDTKVARAFYSHLPCTIELTLWGREAYGPIPFDLGDEKPVPSIPPGGLAYTRKGNYFCIFFGQQPAWAVEYIGQIAGETWRSLVGKRDISRVTVMR
ncbi:MAG: cyclophilin-like fold protein [Spirochaetota bacterium]